MEPRIQIWCFVLMTIIYGVISTCPNHCNSHGVCDKFGRCTCDAEYQGADCSERICPFGIAWSDAATAIDVAHAEAECSNRGLCNRKTAHCECMAGFSGSSCERLDCHDACNQKGVCRSMKDFAGRTRNDHSELFTYTTRWDSDKIKGCQCDYPATGYDCSQTLCPNGDDPLTAGQVNEVQLLLCAATAGTFVLFYNGAPSTSISYAANPALIRSALKNIPGLTDVKVSFSQPHGTMCQVKPNVVSIEFISQFGPQYPLVPLYDSVFEAAGGSVQVSADGATTFTDVSGITYKSTKGTKEGAQCANRGYCDLSDGVCACYDTNGDVYGSSDGYGNAGARGDCGYIVSSTLTAGVSTCPGALQCSGHGVCDPSTFQCYCSAGWYGGDCALMECPQGRSWFGYPTADESAHLDYATCSNMGTCDSAVGKCKCREGFYGEACEYMACGGPASNPCNGHGRCMTMAELALWTDKNGDATAYVYGSDPNNFATWDYDRVHGCRCDEGYSGYDCSLVDCPRGDDAGTYEDRTEVQLLQCVADLGNFTLSFRQAVTPPLSFNITARDLERELNKLHTIKNVAVYYAYDGPPPNGTLNYIKLPLPEVPGQPSWGRFFYNSAADTTLFLKDTPPVVNLAGFLHNSTFCRADGTQVAIIAFEYNHGDLPAIIPSNVNLFDVVNHNGEPFSGVINVFTDGAAVHGLHSVKGTTETDVCNNRGLCDTSTGTCQCFPLWTSGDGRRQGGPGSVADCGYRNDQLFTSF